MPTASYRALSWSLLNPCYFQYSSIDVYNTTVETLAFAIIGVLSFHITYFLPIRPEGGSKGNLPRLTVFLGTEQL